MSTISHQSLFLSTYTIQQT